MSFFFFSFGVSLSRLEGNIIFLLHIVATCPSRASEARLMGALSKGGKMRGVATNVYLWKTSEKPKETGQNKNSKFGSYIYV